MKFAKELEQDLVPEWRIKYLDYKAGKKHVKAVARATNRMNATPRTPAQPNIRPTNSIYGATSPFALQAQSIPQTDGNNDGPTESLRGSPAAFAVDSRPNSAASEEDFRSREPAKSATPMSIPARKRSPEISDDLGKYGSFVPTPPRAKMGFELPDPALTLHQSHNSSGMASPNQMKLDENGRPIPARSASIAVPQSAYEVGPTATPPHRYGTFATLRNRIPPSGEVRPFIRRMFSVGAPLTPSDSRRLDVDMVVVDQVRARQKDFFKWMDNQLDKVETFYRSKEDEAGARMRILKEQLHEMRNRRIEELARSQNAKAIRKEEERKVFDFHGGRGSNGHSKKDDDYRPDSRDRLNAWFGPVERVLESAKARVTGPHVGKNSKALQSMQASPEILAKPQNSATRAGDEGRDYVRRPHYSDEVPYRLAKRKLKLALQEYYRGMELLKSYALLNRTAFRKINKKYDKAVNAHPPLRYMSEKVNKAYFVNSEVLDGHIHAVEDLYARYFEKGNHKIATGKLRSSRGRPADQSRSAFQNGILIGTGAVFAVQGVIYAAKLLRHEDPTMKLQTSYLLQIYGGYFLALYLFSWFCLDCSLWSRNKINYQFVFEFDPRHNLDWRQLSEFPSFFLLVLGLFLWLNFSGYGTPEMYIYYPVLLIFITVVLVFFPGPIGFHRSRRWLVYSHWRLLLAGLYPVEFRDFFLGDMYCSLTYLMSNIELFFCLYANYWNNPTQCNSTHSRLLGFFSTLPGIWRLLQCLRRYLDTRNIFPHLVNGGKYTMTILYYVTLSIYRIRQTHTNLAMFITFATINSLYCSTWDLFMDWSLLQPNASRKFLRDVRGYKSTWIYYTAMILDPILRFNWIFYAIYTSDLQHSTIVSFLVAFSEATRRGMWVLLRVENEHCSNVARFKASRDVPLPYDVHNVDEVEEERTHSRQSSSSGPDQQPGESSPALSRRRTTTGTVSGATLEAQTTNTSSFRRRPGTITQTPVRTFTKVLADAHTQDFEKKRKPEAAGRKDTEDDDEPDRGAASSDEDSEDDDLESVADILDAEALLRERRGPEPSPGRGGPSRN